MASKQKAAAPAPPPPPTETQGSDVGKSTQESSSSSLDLAFCLDCTASMGSYIQSAQNNIRSIVEKIVAAESADVRFGLVGYRDHPPEESSWITKPYEFTASLKTMRAQLDSLYAVGGGDQPEAVADGLHACIKLDWRKDATKVCVLIADAPPHGVYSSQTRDAFPQGCPAGLDPIQIANDMAKKGITLYAVGVEPPALQFRDFFMALAAITGGQYVPLSNAGLLADVIIGGAQEEMALEKIVREIQDEVKVGESEDVIAQRVHTRMTEEGLQVKRLRISSNDLPEPTKAAQSMAKAKSLKEARAHVPKESSVSVRMRTKAKWKKKEKRSAPVVEGGSSSVSAPAAEPEVEDMPLSLAQASRVSRKAVMRSMM